jgi:hypothetical protein
LQYMKLILVVCVVSVSIVVICSFELDVVMIWGLMLVTAEQENTLHKQNNKFSVIVGYT